MRARELWLDQDVVTRRRARLRALCDLVGVDARTAHYDGSRVVAVVRDAYGVTVTGHPDGRAAKAHLGRLTGRGRVRCWMDLDRGGIQLLIQ